MKYFVIMVALCFLFIRGEELFLQQIQEKDSSLDPTDLTKELVASKTPQKKESNDKSIAKKNLEDLKYQSMDYFEKMMNRLSKTENHTEALVIGVGLLLIGLAFIFAGVQALNFLFGIICCIALTAAFTAFLCLLCETTWDTELGAALSGVAFLFTAPFAQYAIGFADSFAVPLVTGLSTAALAEIVLSVSKVSDDPPYHLKSMSEAASALVGFLVALKIKDAISIVVTSFFGAFLTTMAGSILFDKAPLKDKKVNKYGKLTQTFGQMIE